MNPKRALWNTILTLGPILIGFTTSALAAFARSHPLPYLLAPLLLYTAGLCLFLKAKLSLIGKRRLVTFGPSPMTNENQRLYRMGYLLMVAATLLALIFLASSR